MDVNTKKAAVIVLHELSSDSLILTLRSKDLRSHPGEVCFPGGKWQEGDEGLVSTALRELHEELGIEHSRLTLQRELAPEFTLTGYIIYPWFASISDLFPYQVESKEVSEIVRVAMHEVINPKNYKEIRVKRGGLMLKTYQFTASEYHVWGATVRIMRQLIR